MDVMLFDCFTDNCTEMLDVWPLSEVPRPASCNGFLDLSNKHVVRHWPRGRALAVQDGAYDLIFST